MHFRRAVAGVLLPVFVSGCYTWIEPRVDPAAYIAQEAPGTIRIDIVEPTGTTRYLVHNPTVSDDSLRGSFMFAKRGQWLPLATPGLPIDSVQQPMRVSQFSISKTIGGVLGVAALALVACYLALASSGGVFQ